MAIIVDDNPTVSVARIRRLHPLLEPSCVEIRLEYGCLSMAVRLDQVEATSLRDQLTRLLQNWADEEGE